MIYNPLLIIIFKHWLHNFNIYLIRYETIIALIVNNFLYTKKNQFKYIKYIRDI